MFKSDEMWRRLDLAEKIVLNKQVKGATIKPRALSTKEQNKSFTLKTHPYASEPTESEKEGNFDVC